jgi:hypothetical protein
MADFSAVFSIDTRGLTDFARIREDGPRIVQKNLMLGMEGGVRDLHQSILDLTPRCRSGALQGSLQKTIVQDARNIRGTVKSLGSIAPHNRWVIEGRGPVVARKGKALRLTLCNGTVLFRKRVKATPANDFMGRGSANAAPRVLRHFDAAIDRIVVELGG